MITKQTFESFSPYDRGYAVYYFGNRDDQPNIPSEKNPYPENTESHDEWNKGNCQAMLEVQDLDDC